MELIGEQALLFTDIEGSTALFQRVGDLYPRMLDTHHRILRHAIHASGGEEVQSEGDGFVARFDDVIGAVEAALAAQVGLASTTWPADVEICSRMGVHIGDILSSESGLIGMALHEASRISSAAHGGQVLVSRPVAELLNESDALPRRVSLRSLGTYMLKDIGRTELLQLEHPSLAAVFPPLRATQHHLNNLPAHESELIGRDDDLKRLGHLMKSRRLLSLVGSGGVGKTRLAVALATQEFENFAGGARFVELADVENPNDVVRAVATALKLPASVADLADVQVRLGRGEPTLLILDNCEHVLEEAASLASGLLEKCPGLTILATSQEPLGLTAEEWWRVPSLQTDAAVTLFRQRVGRVRPGYTFDPIDDAASERICRRLDGIPLAIELAAARCRSLSLDEVDARLEDRFGLLTSSATDTPLRHQTLRAAVDWSFSLLTPRERHFAYRLGVFRTSADLEAIEAVCAGDEEDAGSVIDLVDSLNSKSLLVIEIVGRRSRIRFLETIRQYVRAHLEASGELDSLVDRHAQHFCGFMARASVGWRSAARAGWLQRCHQDAENLATACDWLETHDPDAAASLLCDGHVWLTAEDGLAWTGRLQRLTDRPDLLPERQVELSAQRALLAEVYGRESVDVAATYAKRAFRDLEEVVDPSVRLTVLANIALGLRTYDRPLSLELSERALADARALGDDQALAATMYDLILLRPEHDPVTREMRSELIRLSSAQGQPWWGITPLVYEALDAHQQGLYERAKDLLDRAEGILGTAARSEAVFTDEAINFTVWSCLVRAEQGDVGEAVILGQDTLARLGEESPHQSKVVQSTLGTALMLVGRPDEARLAFARAMDRADGYRYLVYRIAAHGAALLAIEAGDTSRGRDLLAPLVEDEDRQPWLQARAHDALASAALRDGHTAVAREHVRRADELLIGESFSIPPALRERYGAIRAALE